MAKRKRVMVHLPEDIVVREILPRLPVRSLLRFRCVSKKICSLIDSADFIKHHLIINDKRSNNITETNQLHVLIGGSGLYSFSLEGLACRSLQFLYPHTIRGYSFTLQGMPVSKPIQLCLPLNHYYGIYGSVNGLLCLPNCNRITSHDNIIIILNPVTKRYHQLPLPHAFSPPCPPYYELIHQKHFGFGYDSVSDDFKLLRIEPTFCRRFLGDVVVDHLATKAQVYSLRSNSWKIIQDLPADYKFSFRSGEFVCGALHWMVSLPHSNQTEIFAFDIVTEKHKLVAKPHSNQDMCYILTTLGKLEGCLSLACNNNGDRFDVWVMKDYGVKESWNKLFSISYKKEMNLYTSLTPLAYSEQGDEILLVMQSSGIELLWYNLETRKARKIYCAFEFRPFICGESMVPLSTKAESMM